MLKAILAQPMLTRDCRIDPERYNLFGYSGGAHVDRHMPGASDFESVIEYLGSRE